MRMAVLKCKCFYTLMGLINYYGQKNNNKTKYIPATSLKRKEKKAKHLKSGCLSQ